LESLGEIQLIVRVPSELLSLSDASRLLGVSVERVRQLVVAGDLPGQRFGNAWAVPREALIARRHQAGRGGRPLGPMRAWREVVAGDVDLGCRGRYQRRAKVVRCEMSRADVDALSGAVGALDGGVRAAIALGSPLAASDERDVYLPRSAFGELGSRVAVVPDPLGPIRLRVVDDDAWSLIPLDKRAPRGAIALDLLDSGDPRHWIAAEGLLADA
jgi:excisionase family DNA binding protein